MKVPIKQRKKAGASRPVVRSADLVLALESAPVIDLDTCPAVVQTPIASRPYVSMLAKRNNWTCLTVPLTNGDCLVFRIEARNLRPRAARGSRM